MSKKNLSNIETPSGKGSRDENFPVASWVISSHLRPHIKTFYSFARAADDIADNPNLPAKEKVRRLNIFQSVLMGGVKNRKRCPKAGSLKKSNHRLGITPIYGKKLLEAFKKDAVKLRYKSWKDLIGYCNLSAAPVGRYLLDLHGESKNIYKYSDDLCNALQIINHLQDCKEDYINLDRIYLPQSWIKAQKIPNSQLGERESSKGLRHVIDKTLSGVEKLLKSASLLPKKIENSRLSTEAEIIYRIACKLTKELRIKDPLQEKVELSKVSFLLCGVKGLLFSWFRN
jgi:squalene synthase HpnC